MIVARDIEKNWDSVQALSGISFNIERGELFGFIGPDGAGKTTLFRILTTLLVPDAGSVTIMGHDTVKGYRELRKNIGYMPGRFSLYQDLTVEENLEFYATVFGTTISENYDLIADIYRQIEPFKKRPAGKLSGGMKQKLALSCAMIHKPELLILDEPTTGVDAVSRAEFWDMLKKLITKGITIVVSTPYMDEATRCSRIALIQSGKLLEVDTPANIRSGFSTTLYTVTASDNYKLLKTLREYRNTGSAYAFGDSVHLTLREGQPGEELYRFLGEHGIENLKIGESPAGIEDRFLELMEKK